MESALLQGGVGVLLQTAADGLLEVVKNPVKKTFYCKKACKRLQRKLEGMIPVLKEVYEADVELSEPRQKSLRNFYEALLEGNKMVQECSKVGSLDFVELYTYAGEIADLELYIDQFTRTQGWAHTLAEVRLLRVNLEAKFENVEHKIEEIGGNLENVEHKIEEIGGNLENVEHKIEEIGGHLEGKFQNFEGKFQNSEDKVKQFIGELFERLMKGQILENDKNPFPLSILELPDFLVGLEISVRELKKRFLFKDVPLLGVVGMGGSGKTTLAKAFCNDIEVQDHFTHHSKKRIIFQTVSRPHNIMDILDSMWLQMVPGNKPNFRDIQDARRQVQEKLCPKEPQPTLVVLDDVWEMNDLRKLLFKGEGCKTLITTRNNDIVTSDQRYEKSLLELSDAVPLFCHWAFGQRSIPETADNNLVREVISKCCGLPLALEVIGRYLCERSHGAWVTAIDDLSQGHPVSDDHEDELLRYLATSIAILKKEVRECFLDMGIFLPARKISADVLLDLGVYVHGLRPEKAYTILIELASRNLVNLVNNKKDTLWNFYESICELNFIQHGIMRELAIYLTEKEPEINRRKRFIMPRKADSFRRMWKKHAGSPFDAEIVSFTTGSMQEKDWCQMDFPNVKALILNFSATEYFLPPFMQSMNKLKVLIIVNNSSKRATLKGTSVFSSLTRLKVVRLQRVIVPPGLQEYWLSWRKLEKSSLILCEGFENMTPLHIGSDLNFPRLLEFNIDHCSNLKELPGSICQMTSLKRLSVTNCHDLHKLSDDMEKLSSLQMLRLSGCPSLKELPNSICKLRQLQFLDISFCYGIKQLPDDLGRLSSLRKLDMRDCDGVSRLPRSTCDLKPRIDLVICGKQIEHQWLEVIGSSKVEVAVERFSLDWLDH